MFWDFGSGVATHDQELLFKPFSARLSMERDSDYIYHTVFVKPIRHNSTTFHKNRAHAFGLAVNV